MSAALVRKSLALLDDDFNEKNKGTWKNKVFKFEMYFNTCTFPTYIICCEWEKLILYQLPIDSIVK